MLGNLLVFTTLAFAYAYIFYTIKDKAARIVLCATGVVLLLEFMGAI